MRRDGEVRQRLKQLRFRTIKKEIENLLDVTAKNCRFNYLLKTKQPSNEYFKRTLDSSVSVCKCPDMELHICDSGLCVEDPAKQCSYFKPRHDKNNIKDSLNLFLDTSTIEEISVRYPHIAAIMWFIQQEED